MFLKQYMHLALLEKKHKNTGVRASMFSYRAFGYLSEPKRSFNGENVTKCKFSFFELISKEIRIKSASAHALLGTTKASFILYWIWFHVGTIAAPFQCKGRAEWNRHSFSLCTEMIYVGIWNDWTVFCKYSLPKRYPLVFTLQFQRHKIQYVMYQSCCKSQVPSAKAWPNRTDPIIFARWTGPKTREQAFSHLAAKHHGY